MLNTVHKQLLASKLADMFISCPLILIYQVIGNVQSKKIEASIQRQMDAAVPEHGLRATCLKTKNTVGSLSRGLGLSSYLKANNFLLGWQIPQNSTLTTTHASAKTGVLDILKIARCGATAHGPGQTSQQTRTQPSPLPHRILAPALKHSLQLQEQAPVALLAALYQGGIVSLRHLRPWTLLNEAQVMADLLGEIDSIGANIILPIEEAPQLLLSTLDQAAASEDLLWLLENRGQNSLKQGSKAATPAASA